MTISSGLQDDSATNESQLRELQVRIESLERTVRFLIDAKDKQDPAGRPAFKRPEFVTVGEGCRIGNGVTMSANEKSSIEIGNQTRILRGSELLGPLTIGSRVFINRDAYIRSRVRIGDGVSIGPFARLISDSHQIGDATHRAGAGKTEDILLEDGVWLGANVVVLGGVTIGSGSIVAAGAVVVDSIPPNCIAAGVPAKVIRHIEES